MTLSTLSEDRLNTLERENGVEGKEAGDSTNSVMMESRPDSKPLTEEEEEDEEENDDEDDDDEEDEEEDEDDDEGTGRCILIVALNGLLGT